MKWSPTIVVSQVIRGGPFQIIDRAELPRSHPAAFLYLRGRQSPAPLTAARLGQILERANLRFEPVEFLEYRPLLAHRRC